MAATLKGEARVDIAGKPYRLVLDFNAICAFEAAIEGDVWQVLAQFEAGLATPRQIRALVHAMASAHHPQMTLAEAGDLVQLGGQDLGAAMDAALSAASASASAGPILDASSPDRPNPDKPGKKPKRARG